MDRSSAGGRRYSDDRHRLQPDAHYRAPFAGPNRGTPPPHSQWQSHSTHDPAHRGSRHYDQQYSSSSRRSRSRSRSRDRYDGYQHRPREQQFQQPQPPPPPPPQISASAMSLPLPPRPYSAAAAAGANAGAGAGAGATNNSQHQQSQQPRLAPQAVTREQRFGAPPPGGRFAPPPEGRFAPPPPSSSSSSYSNHNFSYSSNSSYSNNSSFSNNSYSNSSYDARRSQPSQRYSSHQDQRQQHSSSSSSSSSSHYSSPQHHSSHPHSHSNSGRGSASSASSASSDPLSRAPPAAPSVRPAPLMGHVAPSARGRYAYVFLVMKGDSYAVGAITGAYSLKLTGTVHDLVCMVTPDVSQACRATMRAVFDQVVEVPYLQYQVKPLRTQKQRNMYNAWVESAFTKWNMLSLVAYEKTLFVDADKIVLSNLDHLFEDVAAPAGTFSSPWSQPFVERKERFAAAAAGGGAGRGRGRFAQTRGMSNPYVSCGHNARVTSNMVYEALTNQSFVVIGTVVLLSPNKEDYEQYKNMLTTLLPFGFEDCHSMMDEQSLSYYFAIYKNQLIQSGEYGKLTDVKGDAAPSPSSSAATTVDAAAAAAAASAPASLAPPSSSSASAPVAVTSYVPLGSVSEWSYIHHCYNYVPWHRYWLDGDEVPYVFHFFNTKPWVMERKAFLDLEAWWEVVSCLLSESSGLSESTRSTLRALYPAEQLAEATIPGCCWCRLSQEQAGSAAAGDNSWKSHNVFNAQGQIACPALLAGFEKDAQRRRTANSQQKTNITTTAATAAAAASSSSPSS